MGTTEIWYLVAWYSCKLVASGLRAPTHKVVSHTVSSKQMENTHVYISVYRLLLKALVISSTDSLPLDLA